MNEPQFIYRLGSVTSRHIVLREAQKGSFILSEGENVIGKDVIPSTTPEKLGTFVRFTFYRHFLGDEKYKSALRSHKLQAALTIDYPVIHVVEKKEKKKIPLRPVVVVASPEVLTQPVAESIKADEPIEEDRPHWITQILAEDKLPLLVAVGIGIGGPVYPKEQTSSSSRGLEFGVGAHFKKGWSTKLFYRSFNARNSLGDSILQQKMTGLLVMKTMEDTPVFVSAGFAKEALTKAAVADQQMNKALIGMGVSLGGFASFEVREEIPLSSYRKDFGEETQFSFIPVFILSFGHYL